MARLVQLSLSTFPFYCIVRVYFFVGTHHSFTLRHTLNVSLKSLVIFAIKVSDLSMNSVHSLTTITTHRSTREI